jgi:two-component system phosphate regulon response regulator PhoB
MRELLLRIDASLRRSKGGGTPEAIIQFGSLRIHRKAHRVWVSEGELELTALEFKLLVALYDYRNRVRTTTALLDQVWGMSADITTRTVDAHVKRLREKLGPAGEYIETVRGVGYRFARDPERV